MPVLHAIKLLLPALIPSWNFFDIITASPRIQYRLFKNEQLTQDWQEFRPRPQKLSLKQFIWRLFWNPKWNESLFMMSCAERMTGGLSQKQIQHSEREISQRIEKELIKYSNNATDFQFRLLYIKRVEETLEEEILFTSPQYKLCRTRKI